MPSALPMIQLPTIRQPIEVVESESFSYCFPHTLVSQGCLKVGDAAKPFAFPRTSTTSLPNKNDVKYMAP